MSISCKGIIVAALALFGTALAAQSSFPDKLHAFLPLGAEAYNVRNDKWDELLTLLVSAESPGFEGMLHRTLGRHAAMYGADGNRVETFPGRVSFRITASYRTHFTAPSPFPIGATSADANDYLLHLSFRVVAFDGLRQNVLKPEAVDMIGVPGEVPYDERIYRVTVDLSQVPITDRVVLEIHDPNGGRICKFHLDLL